MNGKQSFSLILILCVVLVAGVASAQDNLNITCIHQYYHNWQDGVWGVAVRGNEVFLACGNEGLRILDLSDPESPTVLGQFPSESAQVVAVRGNWAFLGFYSGLRVLDVSDPTDPTEVLQVPLLGYPSAIAIVNDVAFVTCYGGGLTFLDISNPVETEVIWSSYGEYSGDDIEVHGNRAYVACNFEGLIVLDITELTSPQVVGNYRTSGGYYVTGASISGGYAYLASGWNGFEVVDLATMQMVASIDSLNYAFGVEVVGNYVYVSYGDPECPLAIVDVSNPLTPQTIGVYYPPSDIARFAVAGDLVYVADRYHGLRTVDVSVPSNPQEIHRYSRYGHDLNVILAGNRAYVQEDYKLKIVDITDLENPQELGYYEMSWPYGDLDIVGNVAFLTTHGYTCAHAVDVSNATSPSLLGTFRVTEYDVHYRMAVYDHYAYLVENDGLRIVDIADPAHMEEVGYFHRYIGNAMLTVHDHYGYLMGQDHLLVALDLSDPTSPTVAGSRPLGDEYCVDMKVADGILYVATAHTLWAFNATSFHQWAPLAEVSLVSGYGRYLHGLDAHGQYLYVTADSLGLCVLDVSDLSASVLTGRYRTPGEPYGVAAMGNIAVVADYDNLGFYNCSGALPAGERRASENPQAFAVLPAYPNPFNSSTQIPFEIAAQNRVTILIFDVLGRTVTTLTDQEFAAGRHTLRWDGKDGSGQMVASGRYFVQVRAGDAMHSVPILYLK